MGRVMVTLGSLRRNASRTLDEIRQLESDVAWWNRTRPEDAPIDWDPDGQMAKCRTYCKAMIADIDKRTDIIP